MNSVRKLGAIPSGAGTGARPPAGVVIGSAGVMAGAAEAPARSDADGYRSQFGSGAYVTDGADLRLIALVRKVAEKAPALQAEPLGQHAKAGRLDAADIKALQRFLVASGQTVGAPGIDGKYGPLTHQALRSFLLGSTPSSAPLPKASPPPAVSEAVSRTKPESVIGSGPAPVSGPAPEPAPDPRPGTAVATNFPPRDPGAPTGSQVVERIRNLPLAQREDAIVREVLAGNVPDFLRQLASVRVAARGADGRVHEAVIPVLPDYLAVGSDADFVRVPLGPLAAQRIADRLGFGLPTRKLVDAVYDQASTRIAPRPMPPIGHQMMTVDYFDRHNRTLEAQLADHAGHRPGDLTAGHKKDVIVGNAVGQHPGRVIIYGWQQTGGKAIQPLSWIHEDTYSDYSHGVRFVGKTILVDGQPRDLGEVMRDPDLAPLVSDEGPIRSSRYPV